MPNGFYGSSSEWHELAGQLEIIDPELEAFASAHALELLRNQRAWPGRQLRWCDDLRRSIHISLADEYRRTYALGVAAAADRSGHRYWRGVRIREGMTIEDMRLQITEVLQYGYDLVSSWTLDDLEDTGPLRGEE
jgi:hypothetical protein